MRNDQHDCKIDLTYCNETNHYLTAIMYNKKTGIQIIKLIIYLV